MRATTIAVGVMKTNFDGRCLAANSTHIYWVADERLFRQPIGIAGLNGPVEVVAEPFVASAVTVNDTHLCWVDERRAVKVTVLQGPFVAGATTVVSEGAEKIALDLDMLYWSEGEHLVRRRLSADTSPVLVEDKWKGKDFVLGQGRICFADRENRLLLHAMAGERITEEMEVLSDAWHCTTMTGFGEHIYWVTPDGRLCRGKRTERDGYYFHFDNEAMTWDELDAMKREMSASVLQSGVHYYSTELNRQSPTGTPYKPKHQDWEYTVRFALRAIPHGSKPTEYIHYPQVLRIDRGSLWCGLMKRNGKLEIIVEPFPDPKSELSQQAARPDE